MGIMGSVNIFVSVSDTRLDLNLDDDVEILNEKNGGGKMGILVNNS